MTYLSSFFLWKTSYVLFCELPQVSFQIAQKLFCPVFCASSSRLLFVRLYRVWGFSYLSSSMAISHTLTLWVLSIVFSLIYRSLKMRSMVSVAKERSILLSPFGELNIGGLFGWFNRKYSSLMRNSTTTSPFICTGIKQSVDLGVKTTRDNRAVVSSGNW